MRVETPQFEVLLESAPDAILLVDGAGRIVLINRRTEELFGYAREELVGRGIEALVPGRFQELHEAHRAGYLAEPRTRPMGAGIDLAGLRRDGSEFPVEISLSPMESEGETLVITIVRDVSERKAAETRFRTLLESAPDAILLVDAAGRIVLANRRSEELFGYAADALLGRNVEDLVPGRFTAGHGEHRADYLREPRTRPMGAGLELHGLRADGTEFPVEISLSPLVNGDETLVTTIIRDITERKAAESERLLLARAEAARAEAVAAAARLEELLGDLDAIVWEAEGVDRERFTFVGGRAEKILGFPPARWTQISGFWSARLHGDDGARVVAVGREAALARRDHELEYRMTAADGRTVWMRDIVRVAREEDGTGVRLRGVMVDVTERRELEGRLLQSQKLEAIGQLAGGVAHDFNNLLTVILGFTRLLAGHVGEDGRPELQQIEEAAERATALTRQLLAFSRRGAGEVALVDVGRLLRNLEQMLRRLIDEDIELTVIAGEGPLLVRADGSALEQAIVNLVVNARDAMPHGGVLRVSATATEPAAGAADGGTGREVLIAVADTGVGMDQETRDRAFEPFFTTKPPGHGTGLGLATVYGSVEQADGRVEIDSEPGHGTEIRLWLPAGSPDTEDPLDDGGRGTILVVEDEPSLRRLVRTILEREGYRVLEAPHGREALALADRHGASIDVVLTDIVMPEMSGPELLEHLARRWPGVRTILMSGYADSRLAGRGVAQEAVHLRKPFRAEELLECLAEVLVAAPS